MGSNHSARTRYAMDSSHSSSSVRHNAQESRQEKAKTFAHWTQTKFQPSATVSRWPHHAPVYSDNTTHVLAWGKERLSLPIQRPVDSPWYRGEKENDSVPALRPHEKCIALSLSHKEHSQFLYNIKSDTIQWIEKKHTLLKRKYTQNIHDYPPREGCHIESARPEEASSMKLNADVRHPSSTYMHK